MRYFPEPKFQHGELLKTGILLVNLGTPTAPTPKALRVYLKQFLSDSRVVELPRLLWWMILNGIILNTRPKKSAEKYAAIWTKEGSPLRVHTEKQAVLLRGYLGERIKTPHALAWAMRYGAPSIESALLELRKQNCDRILILPLYPQYSASTTASVFDAVADTVRRMRNAPALRYVRNFHDHPAYIAATARQISEYWMANGRPDKLVLSFHGVPRFTLTKGDPYHCEWLSFHGVPRFTLTKGDPYHCECQKTARLIGQELGLKSDDLIVSFQSRFGRAEWLTPYTIDVMARLGKERTGRIDVFCPGFVADCLETLEEIAIENKAKFMKTGGKEFHHIPCLNERHEWIQALARICAENLHGWASTDFDPAAARQAAQASRSHATALGAKY